MSYRVIIANSSHRCWLDRFSVVTELLGARHTFEHNGRQVSIELPTAPKEEREFPSDDADVWCHTWRSEGHIPLAYQVRRITLRVATGTDISVPEEALKLPPRRDELFTKPERDHLNKLIDQHSDFAADAFRYWLSVIRWKSTIGHIGEVQVRGPDFSSGGAALEETGSGRRFWLQPVMIVGQARRAVTLSEWQATQAALSDSKIPPIWFDFLFEGEQRINNLDLTGAVLSLAIALEAVVRSLVTHHLSLQKIEPLIHEVIDRTNLRAILNRLRTLTFWNSEWDKVADFSAFNTLMNYRDKVMHSADTGDLDSKELREMYRKLKSFAYFVSTFLGKE